MALHGVVKQAFQSSSKDIKLIFQIDLGHHFEFPE